MSQRFIFSEQPAPSEHPTWELIVGDALQSLRMIPDGTVRCWMTSPPYYKKVDYGHELQCGLEETIREYIAYQSDVAVEMLRASTPDANLFWVIQDTYNYSGGTGGDYLKDGKYRIKTVRGPRVREWERKAQLLIPERTRIALAAAGWVPWLKMIWNKDDPFRSAIDRPSYSYEEILCFSPGPDHYWDHDAVRWPKAAATQAQLGKPYTAKGDVEHFRGIGRENPSDLKRRVTEKMNNGDGTVRVRAVWNINAGSQPTIVMNGKKRRAVASYPQLLADALISLGSAPGDTVSDPYSGWGTTLLSALKLGRSAIGIEINPNTAHIAETRLVRAGFKANEKPINISRKD